MKTSGFAPPPPPQLKPSAADFVAGADTRATAPPSAPAEIPAAVPAPDSAKPVRITVDLPPSLHRRAKIEALNQGKPMSDLIREWIELHCKQ